MDSKEQLRMKKALRHTGGTSSRVLPLSSETSFFLVDRERTSAALLMCALVGHGTETYSDRNSAY
jgi:hypothetical protein